MMTGVHGEVRWDVCVFTGNNDWCAWRGALGRVCVLLVIMTGVHGEVRWDLCVFYW